MGGKCATNVEFLVFPEKDEIESNFDNFIAPRVHAQYKKASSLIVGGKCAMNADFLTTSAVVLA